MKQMIFCVSRNSSGVVTSEKTHDDTGASLDGMALVKMGTGRIGVTHPENLQSWPEGTTCSASNMHYNDGVTSTDILMDDNLICNIYTKVDGVLSDFEFLNMEVCIKVPEPA